MLRAFIHLLWSVATCWVLLAKIWPYSNFVSFLFCMFLCPILLHTISNAILLLVRLLPCTGALFLKMREQKANIYLLLLRKESLKEGYHDSADVSKSKYLCSLLINVIAFKPYSDLIQESHAIVSRGRITDDQTWIQRRFIRRYQAWNLGLTRTIYFASKMNKLAYD